MSKVVKVNDTLSVEISVDGGLRIVRRGGGLVLVSLSEVSDLVAALSDLAARAAAETAGEEYQENLF